MRQRWRTGLAPTTSRARRRWSPARPTPSRARLAPSDATRRAAETPRKTRSIPDPNAFAAPRHPRDAKDASLPLEDETRAIDRATWNAVNDGAGKVNANRTSEKRSTRPGNARETANEISNANEPASRKMTARTARTARRPARRTARPSRRARRLFASRTRLRSTQTAPRARRMSISSSDTEASPALGSTRAKKGPGSRARARARARAPARGWSGGVRRVRFVGERWRGRRWAPP